MPHVLTQIIEGPRDSDGRVRFLCEACGETTTWIMPPTGDGQTEHWCKESHEHIATARMMGLDPTVEMLLNSAATCLRKAAAKTPREDTKELIEESLSTLEFLVKNLP